MYNKFNKTIDSEENKAQLNVIKGDLIKVVERSPTYDENKY